MPTLFLTATVVQLAAHPSADQLWSIETTVTVATEHGELSFELPGGRIEDTMVIVSHQPRLQLGDRYHLALVDTGDGLRALSAVPLSTDVVPEDALFYELAGSAWPTAELAIPFSLADGTFPSSLDDDALLDAFIDGVEVWNQQGGARVFLPWQPSTTDTQYGSGANGSNAVMWSSYHWGSTIAISARTVVGSEIIDCDIQFFGSNGNGSIDWNVDPAGAPDGQSALRHTLVHELGHCIGISHSSDDAALMSSFAPDDQGPSSWRLHADDQDAVVALYGRATPELAVAGVRLQGSELEVNLDNTGDWDAWLVSVDIEGGVLPDAPALVDRVPVGISTVVLPATATSCGELELELTLVDGQGSSWHDRAVLDVDCDQVDGGGEGAGAWCSCDATPGLPGWWLALPLLAGIRRSRG